MDISPNLQLKLVSFDAVTDMTDSTSPVVTVSVDTSILQCYCTDRSHQVSAETLEF